MPQINQMKTGARRLLRKNLGRTCAVLFFFLLLYAGIILLERYTRAYLGQPQVLPTGQWNTSPGSIGLLAAFLCIRLLLLTPIAYGILRWLSALVYGGRQGIGTIFYYYASRKNFGRMLWFHLRALIELICRGGVFVVLALLTRETVVRSLVELSGFWAPEWFYTGAAWVSFFLWITAALFLLAGLQRCWLALFAFFDGLPVQKAFSQARRISRKKNVRMTAFLCSFLGWGLLSLLILPLFYTIPYFVLSENCLYRKTLSLSNQDTLTVLKAS